MLEKGKDMSDVSLDEDIVVIEALDFDPACTAYDTCDKTAAWLLRRTCCTYVDLVCDPHKTNMIDALKKYSTTLICAPCKTGSLTADDFLWEKL